MRRLAMMCAETALPIWRCNATFCSANCLQMELGGKDAAIECANADLAGFLISLAAPIPATCLQMELGGKDAAIVCADADLASTASHIVKGAFSYSGQRCTGERSSLAWEHCRRADSTPLLAPDHLCPSFNSHL